MAYDEILAERVSDVLYSQNVSFKQKKMFGGMAFMVRNKMCVGVLKQELMVRIDPDIHERALARKGAREMDFTGRPMQGFVLVDPDGTGTTARLRYWVDMALEYNPKAKSSKKKPARKKR